MKILIVRLGAAGDLIHALPALNTLKENRPDWEIDWLVKPFFFPFLSADRRIARVVSLPAAGPGREPGAWSRLIGFLQRQNYDAAIDLQGLIKSALLARISRARRVIGFRTTREYTRFFYDERYPRRGRHVAEMNSRLIVDAFPGLRPSLRAGITIPEGGREFARDWFAAHGGRGTKVIVNTGGGWPTKRYPPSLLQSAMEEVCRRSRIERYHLLSGPGEEELAREACGEHGLIIPPNNFAQMLGLLEAADLVVSGDTAPLHAAAALGRVCVGLYGPTSPERNGAFQARGTAVYHDCACRNCYRRVCRHWICMPGLEPSVVAEAVLAALERLTSG